MYLRQPELSTALRPSLKEDAGEVVLFAQTEVGLYEGTYKLPAYQNGTLYLTSHSIYYVDSKDPRTSSIALDLKEVERTEFYAGFWKSSPKITVFPKPSKRHSQSIRAPVPRYASPSDALAGSASVSKPAASTTIRDVSATWICPICGLSNLVPSSFDPSTANQYTPLPPCQACGIKPPLVHLVKAAIAAMSSRPAGSTAGHSSVGLPNGANNSPVSEGMDPGQCPRCTFHNHPSLKVCEICGAPLQSTEDSGVVAASSIVRRPESPGPTTSESIVGQDIIETIKFSFRNGGAPTFHERLRGALIQRKWLLYSAPPVPRPGGSNSPSNVTPWPAPDSRSGTATPQPRVVGIAGLEKRGAELRHNYQTVIGTAFEDLEALMTSAKEVIALAEDFRKQTDNGTNGESAEARSLLSDSASALGLITTKDMLGTSSTSETLYITELARNLAEFLTDDRRRILRKEGGIMSLVDLWAVFNRTRNGIELVSPLDFEKAATMWESLNLPIRLRRFKSGLLVVQEKNRTDEKTINSLLSWLREPRYTVNASDNELVDQPFGRGATAQETAERFHWSVGVATEELEMAEETGALCRDQCLDGTRFWENHFMQASGEPAHGEAPPLVQKMNAINI
jgi:ESCRT-II complex subunit VPS36